MTTHEAQSSATKKRLSDSLKKLMGTQEFHKISINALVKDAGLNRNSFYYHFNNIFDLLKYTFEKDTVRIVKQNNSNGDLKQTIYFIMDYIDRNKAFCACAYRSLGKTELRKFLRNNFQDLIINVVDDIIERKNLTVSYDFKQYVIYWHTELMAIHIIGYLENDLQLSEAQIADYILSAFYGSVISALEIAARHHL